MKHIKRVLLCGLVFHSAALLAQNAPNPPQPAESTDTAAIARIIDQGLNHSQVMETLSWLSDVCGARLTQSPGHKRALEWTQSRLEEYGLANVHREGWGPFGRGWYLRHYSANVIDPFPFPLLSYPKAWSPSTNGTVTAEIIHFDAKTDSAVATYRGKLKGKFVLLGDIQILRAHFEPDATRMPDSSLLAMANAEVGVPRRRGGPRGDFSAEARRLRLLEEKKFAMCVEEDAAAVLTPNRGDDGTIFVQGASLPIRTEDTSLVMRPRIYDRNPPATVPQVAVAAEQYNRLVRMLAKGEKVRIEIGLGAEFTREDSAYNVIAELPGTDRRDEVVMIGAHLDSWHGGTGATDNGTGVASCMEAMRILKALGQKPRRTIRIGLWAGEEEGLLGSRSYVRAHLGGRDGDLPSGEIRLKPEAEKFCAYFNSDNGTGKVRGVYLQGNETLRPIFRAWLAQFRAMGASTLTLLSTGSTDHVPFDAIGLPAFQWIQDPIEYFPRTWHSTMDVYERVQEEDLKQASILMAAFAYDAAMRDEKLPRKDR